MTEKKTQVLFWLLSASLLGCSGGMSLRDKIPDRRPDYRQSSTSHRLEVPPDLVSSALHDQLTVPAISGENSISYQDYNLDQYPRNSRGYLDVLPPLPAVQVVEPEGALSYLLVDADVNSTWQAVKKYWQNAGIRLRVEEPAIGLMETDWLEDLSKLPKTGISAFLDDLIQFAHDSGTRDRYRIRFARASNNQTQVTLVYSQAEEKALGSRKDPEGFAWTLNDNDNPELQLEMTRRLAVFISGDLRRQAQRSSIAAPQNAQLSSINGQPALIINQNYASAWQNLSIALERAGFLLEHQDYKKGAYQVSINKTQEAAKDGLLSRIFGRNDKVESLQYVVRLASQGNKAIAVVQNLAGEAESAATAQAVLSRLQTFF